MPQGEVLRLTQIYYFSVRIGWHVCLPEVVILNLRNHTKICARFSKLSLSIPVSIIIYVTSGQQ